MNGEMMALETLRALYSIYKNRTIISPYLLFDLSKQRYFRK